MNENTNLIDEHNEGLTPIEQLSPFKRMVLSLGTLPSAFYETMTYYESLVYFYEYLKNEVIPTVNNNGQAVEELQEKYLELKDYVDNYFDNLDVQEEINAKLDEMATDGTLTNLISNYVDPIYGAYETEINGEISDFKALVNGQLTHIDEKVTNATSGSPKGVYATVSDLTTADPDHDYIYVVTADGKWYYYDTSLSAWTAGGVYQSSGLPPKIDEINTVLGDSNYKTVYTDNKPSNLINIFTLKHGYYVYNGNESASADWNVTDYIEIEPSTQYSVKIGLSCYFDSTKTFLSNQTAVTDGEITTPATAKYIKCSITNANLSSSYITKTITLKPNGTNYPFAVLQDQGITKISHYKDYQSGFIPFTVKVNQNANKEYYVGDSATSDAQDFVDVDCVLKLPTRASLYTNNLNGNIGYSAFGKPSPLVMICHGAGRGVSGTDNWTTNENYIKLIDLLTAHGYAVFDCNGFKNDALGWSFWGDFRGVQAWIKAYEYVTQNYNVEKEVNIYGFSMGGLTAMNLINNGFPFVKSMALASPVLNMEAAWNDNDIQAVLRVLHNIPNSVTDYDDSYFVGINPYKHIQSNRYNTKIPFIKIWYGGNETSGVTNKQYAIDTVNAMVNSGYYASYREVIGAGHEICYGSNNYINIEILRWFNRFNQNI